MRETVCKVEVTDKELIFTEIPCPPDWDVLAVEREYRSEPLNGYYHGNRSYGAKTWSLFRDTKYQQPNPPDNGEYFNAWKRSQYVWEPQGFYDYKGELYTTHCNFR